MWTGKSLGAGDNAFEDTQPARSRMQTVWAEDETFVWTLEVRESLHAVTYRLGEIVLRGSFHGTLTATLIESGVRY